MLSSREYREYWQNDAWKTLWIYGATCLLELIFYIACFLAFIDTRSVASLLIMVGIALFHFLYWGRKGPWVIYKVLYMENKQDWNP